jgi:GNAT superfamily N-acetyltransferase
MNAVIPATFGRLGHVGNPDLYAANAAAMWASMAPWSRPEPAAPPGLAIIHLPAQPATRVILRHAFTTDPGNLGRLLAPGGPRGRVVVEDPFGELSLQTADDVTAARMPVMVRAPGSLTPPAARQGVRIVAATAQDTLAQAERVIVEGFPMQALQPYKPGRSLPPLVLTVPGWRVWLAYSDGEPAAACCTFDDGFTAGVYWLATLPEHRSRGLGRAVLTAALNACQDRPVSLVATKAGEPLYMSLGFQPVSTAAWYRRQTG